MLFKIACDLIEQAGIGSNWTFGGGTAMMLQIDHRESHDIDIFIDDPQRLSYLDPERQDFKFQRMPSSYQGDKSRFQKIVFDGVGEIDFIVCSQMTDDSTIKQDVLGKIVMLETIPEIVTKKVFYRGAQIAPRDIFDIAAASQSHRKEIVAALAAYKPKVEATIQTMERGGEEFINSVIGDLQIKPAFDALKADAIQICMDVLREALADQTAL